MSKGICHDGSPFCDYQCPSCGSIMHVHLTQLPPDYLDLELRTFCKSCADELILPHPVNWIGKENNDVP